MHIVLGVDLCLVQVAREVWQYPHSRPFARSVGDDLKALEHQAKVEHPKYHEQQQWQRQRKLDNSLPAFPVASIRIQRRHKVHNTPIVIGIAYASRGEVASLSVNPGTGPKPCVRQCISINQRFETAVRR